jgi:hypothetical protein
MTAPKSTRRRRRNSASAIPKWIAQWFAGDRAFCFHAYTVPYVEHLGEYWAAWVAEHPDAAKPKDLDSLIAYGKGIARFRLKKQYKTEKE